MIKRGILFLLIIVFSLLQIVFAHHNHVVPSEDQFIEEIQEKIAQTNDPLLKESLADHYFNLDLDIAIEHGVRPNNEPIFLKGNKSIGILLIHGFSASPNEVRSLAEYLNKQGYSVYAPLLAGHGTDEKDLGKFNYEDWKMSTENGVLALQATNDKVFVGGISLGGNIAMDLAKSNDFEGVISISSPISFYDKNIKYASVLRFFINTLPNKKLSEYEKEYYYYRRSVQAIYELYTYININKKDLDKITEPIVILQSIDDPTIDSSSAEYIYDHVSSTDKRIVPFESNSHVLVNDYERDSVFKAVLGFVDEISDQ